MELHGLGRLILLSCWPCSNRVSSVVLVGRPSGRPIRMSGSRCIVFLSSRGRGHHVLDGRSDHLADAHVRPARKCFKGLALFDRHARRSRIHPFDSHWTIPPLYRCVYLYRRNPSQEPSQPQYVGGCPPQARDARTGSVKSVALDGGWAGGRPGEESRGEMGESPKGQTTIQVVAIPHPERILINPGRDVKQTAVVRHLSDLLDRDQTRCRPSRRGAPPFRAMRQISP